MQSNAVLRDIVNTEKLMGNNNNGSPEIMFQMEDDGLTQLGSVFQSAYQSIVGGGSQVKPGSAGGGEGEIWGLGRAWMSSGGGEEQVWDLEVVWRSFREGKSSVAVVEGFWS